MRWIAELLGYPADCGGLFVSGGNMANFVGFFAARRARCRRGTSGRDGVARRRPRLRVYASAETHTWVQKAADLFGLGTDAIRWIPTDARCDWTRRALRDAMAADLAAGDLPMLVVGTAGSVSTGAVDPLPRSPTSAASRALWFHVDGAYGALAAALPDAPPDLQALATGRLGRHRSAQVALRAARGRLRARARRRGAARRRSPTTRPTTTSREGEGDQLRRARAAELARLPRPEGVARAAAGGPEGYVRMIGDDCALAARALRARRGASGARGRHAGPEHRHVPLRPARPARRGGTTAEDYLNALNEDAARPAAARRRGIRLQRGRSRPLPAARLHRQLPNTTEADVDALPGIVARLGRAVDAELRPTELRAESPLKTKGAAPGKAHALRVRHGGDAGGRTTHATGLGDQCTGDCLIA